MTNFLVLKGNGPRLEEFVTVLYHCREFKFLGLGSPSPIVSKVLVVAG
ncbi:MAG: hypothetical protein H2035_05125 [Acidimicrobiales bacterium]|nr:hypothetical protein [Acidimicrobiales bacterium]